MTDPVVNDIPAADMTAEEYAAWAAANYPASGPGIPLSRCTGETSDCPHYDCPDGWHEGTDLPCDCTPDCELSR